MRFSLGLLVILFCIAPLVSNAQVARTSYRIQPSGDFRSLTVESEESRSQFAGFGYGFAIEALSPGTQSRISLLVGFESIETKNSANNDLRSEILRGQTYFLGARYYTGFLFIGARVLAGQRELDVKIPTVNSSLAFLDYGLGGEIGVDLPLGAGLFIAPSAQYRAGYLEPKSSDSPTKKTSEIVLSMSLGLEF